MKYEDIKKKIDFFGALFLIIVLFPLFVFIYILILLSSGWPVMFNQRRMGQIKTFIIYKFRTMQPGARELQKKGVLTRELITFEGRVLRKLHLDELPQLFNILKGDLSFIGPRPLAEWEYYDRYMKYHQYKEIYSKCRPGLMSLNNVLGYMTKARRLKLMKKLRLRYHSSRKRHSKESDAYNIKFMERELYYVRHKGTKLDFKIFCWTVILEMEKLVKVIKKKF